MTATRPVVTNAAIPQALAGLRVLIVHEWLVTWAGSERVAEQIARIFPDADVVVGVQGESMRSGYELAVRARESWVGRIPGARSRHRWFLPLYPAAFASIPTGDYDLVVSSSHAFSKAVRRRPGARHVCYCHTPPRYLWDLQEDYARSASPVQRAALRVAAWPLRALDRAAAAGVDRFVANSRFVADRVGRAYGRSSSVVHPPVARKPLPAGYEPPSKRDDFLLSLGRLVGYKRVDLAVEAALEAGRRLVIAGDGPERRRLERLAGGKVEFLGDVSEEEAGRLLSECAALIFCAEEDFGITPVEANAHGAPVVGYGRGGLRESMVDGRTAVLFDRQLPASVARAIRMLDEREWDERVLMENAARFSEDAFRANMIAELAAAVEGEEGAR